MHKSGSSMASLVLGCLALAGVTGAVVADDLTKPIKVSDDGHFLSQPDGAPFFWLGDTALLLIKYLNREEADRYLRDRAQKGFTVIQAVLIGFHGGQKNRDGEEPLIDNDPARPNPRYFEHVDWIVDRAAHYGLRMALLSAWGDEVTGGYGIAESWPLLFTPATAETYGRWLATRYRQKGIIWVLGGDTNPLWPKTLGFNQFGDRDQTQIANAIIDYRAVYDAMAKGIAEGDGGDPFITYHPTSISFFGTAEPRTSLYLGDRKWLDMNMLQTGHFAEPVYRVMPQMVAAGVNFGRLGTHNYEPITAEYHAQPTRPVIDGENHWEDLPVNQTRGNPYWQPTDSRKGAYRAVFAGAAGHNYGNENVANFYDPALRSPKEMEWRPWWEAIQSPAASQMQYLKKLMLSRPYFTRTPDPSLIIGECGEGERHIGTVRDRQNRYAMIYLPEGQPVTVDLAKLVGSTATAWWYDPRTGRATQLKEPYSTVNAQRFVPPSSGREHDWVLVIDEAGQNFPAPGQMQ